MVPTRPKKIANTGLKARCPRWLPAMPTAVGASFSLMQACLTAFTAIFRLQPPRRAWWKPAG
jgi:hypothetical protein